METKEKILLNCAFELIAEENLPLPTEIRFRRSVSGVRKREGACSKKYATNSFSIIINTIESRFYPDKRGKFRDRKTGQRMSRYTQGKEIKFSRVVKTTAHEIAHLKFWNHTPEHTSYTAHLNQLLINRLKVNGVDINE